MDSLPVIHFDEKTLELIQEECERVRMSALMVAPPHLSEASLTHWCQELRRRLIEAKHFFESVAEVPDPPEATLPIMELADAPTAIIGGNAHHERAMQAAFARE